MVIISKAKIVDFGIRHADSINALNDWFEKTKAADWNSLADIKQTFNSVDFVGND